MAMLTTDRKHPHLAGRTKPTVITPFTPSMPDVNLLPPRVFDAVLAKKARRQLTLAGAVVVLIVAGAYAAQLAQIMVANNALAAETAKSAALDKQVRDLSPVKVFYAGVAAQKLNVQTTMARELRFSDVASELVKNSLAAGVTVETMTVSVADAGATSPGSACPAANPFTPVQVVTCMQFTGTAPGRADVSAFLVNLNNSSKFANVYVPVTDSGDGKKITFNGSVGITEKYFSNRYADDAYLLKGLGAKP
jgi:hypothetical protein